MNTPKAMSGNTIESTKLEATLLTFDFTNQGLRIKHWYTPASVTAASENAATDATAIISVAGLIIKLIAPATVMRNIIFQMPTLSCSLSRITKSSPIKRKAFTGVTTGPNMCTEKFAAQIAAIYAIDKIISHPVVVIAKALVSPCAAA